MEDDNFDSSMSGERDDTELHPPNGSHDLESGSPIREIGDMAEKPYVGKVFESIKEARSYYEKYAFTKGFEVVQRTSQKTRKRNELVTSVLFVCIHYGSYEKKVNEKVPVEKRRPNTSTLRGGCEAQMRILLNVKTKEWAIRLFADVHNHAFVLTPNKLLMKTSQTKISEGAKCMVELFSEQNLPVNKVNSILGGDALGFNDRDCWNHLRDIRQKLDVGDAQWMNIYFQKKQAENPQFYSAIQCDEQGRAVNFFWVDARSMLSYHQFGDVVTFDTTYKTNKYGLPFAPFTGVNHHFQTIQFGCGLLQDETEASFVWLFKTWKEAMGGVAPTSIITDSDPAMRAAIPKVFPNTRHRLCYWHIKMKFGEKLGHIYFKKSRFKREMKQCLMFTYRIGDFEKMWKELMVSYDLEKNPWLVGLYDDREAWVPVYNRTTFFAGMHTTGRSEGVNAFFKDYINSATSLKEFVEKLDQAMMRIENRERAEDHESEQKFRLATDNSFILKHASDIYTRNMFNKFRSTWLNVELLKADVFPSEHETYVVKFKRGMSDDYWMVKMNSNTFEGVCECHYFEFVGLPCAHIMKVFSKLDVDEIPDYFITRRWLKRANRFNLGDKVRLNSEKQTSTMRFGHLCREATQWACVAYQSEEGYKLFLEGIRELGKKIADLSIDKGENVEVVSKPLQEEMPENSQIILDPNVSRTKGRCKGSKNNNSRYKRPIEVAREKNGRRCRGCGEITNHDSRNCPKKLKSDDQGSSEL